jgi:hypothetical protein
MSGGGIGTQGADDRQVVIFTFSGRVAKSDADDWNAAIQSLLDQFGTSLVGATFFDKGGSKPLKQKRRKTR